MSKSATPLKVIDLFSGAGGLTSGFVDLSNCSFESVWANDYNAPAADTYNINFGNHCHVGDIVEILEKNLYKIPKADIVIGGPPCQGFSLLNKNRETDPRKAMWIPFFDVVEKSKAHTFVIENVPQILSSIEFESINERAESLGFRVWKGILFAPDYGVAQIRRRAFIIGSKKNDPNLYFPPRKTHIDPKLKNSNKAYNPNEYVESPLPWRTVRDEIAELPKPVGTEIRSVKPPLDLHFGRTPTSTSLARYKAIPKEGMNRIDLLKNAPELTPQCWINKKSGGTDLFGRLWWDRPAFTIRTEFFKPEKGRYLHPSQHRPITHREAARLQSFSDEFVFSGSKIEIAKQIGNAVPPRLAAAVAKLVYEMINSPKSSKNK